jgi:hypothetical protein
MGPLLTSMYSAVLGITSLQGARMVRATAAVVLVCLVAVGVCAYVAWSQMQPPDLSQQEAALEQLIKEKADAALAGDGAALADLMDDPSVVLWAAWRGESLAKAVDDEARQAIAASSPQYIPPPQLGVTVESVDVTMLGPSGAMAVMTCKMPQFEEPVPAVGLMLLKRGEEWKISAFMIPKA